MLTRVPVWILGCLVYAPALLVIGVISRQPPIFTFIGLVVLAPVGFYIARKTLRDFELPLSAPLSDLIAAIKQKQSRA
jgi:H+/gluconate symporter-like permease